MKRKQYRRESWIRLAIIMGIIVLLNYLSSFIYYRFDLTSEKRFSLSGTTREILRGLDDVVYIKVYLDGELPAGFLRLRNAVSDLLDEFSVVARGNIAYEFIDPSRQDDAGLSRQLIEELYRKGLQPTNVVIEEKDGGTSQKIIFPGAMLSYGGTDVAVNLLKNNPALHSEVNLNNSIQSLEYEFINMIRNLSSDTVEKIAFIEGHGELDQYQTGDITKELANFYQVDRGRIGGVYGSLDSYAAVIIAKPRNRFDEPDKFVIDQYIMNGGKVLWLIDEVQVSLDSLFMGATYALYTPLNIEDQLFRYGVRVNPNLVKDIQCHVIPVNKGLAGGESNWQLSPWFYYPVLVCPDDHLITRNLNAILIEFGSVLDTVGEDPAIKKTILLTSSPYSRAVNVPAEISLRETDRGPLEQEFSQSFLPMAVLLEGTFESVYTNRPLPEISNAEECRFRDVSGETKMIVIADGDVIRNEVSMGPGGPVIGQLGVDKYTSQVFGNRDLILNAVNYLTDQSGLMALRGREFRMRLLDKRRSLDESLKWKLVNSLVPAVLVILFGMIFNNLRMRRYSVNIPGKASS